MSAAAMSLPILPTPGKGQPAVNCCFHFELGLTYNFLGKIHVIYVLFFVCSEINNEKIKGWIFGDYN